ncbi:MAG: SpoIID/LytB domain-containing protein [Thermoleophilia bacterium]|nr:SpoIID/LytB domain-containing protein [Thermoleophilia bacterium]
MRRVLVPFLSLALAGTAAAAASTRPSEPTFVASLAALSLPVYVLTGGGYGHGVGLNQYGAFGQASAGRGYRDILAFYYPGTELSKAPTGKVRVLIGDGRVAVKISSPVPFSVRDGSGTVAEIGPGEIVITPALRIVVEGKPVRLPGPLAFVAGKGAPLRMDGKDYRGEIRLSVVGAKLQAINVLGLDAYLVGVVPGEMPKEWPAAALQAQAVAARSYALASIVKDRPFDLYSDTRSQVYYGVAAESPSTTAAVKATRGEILSYGGKVATAFYYSSSGGRTASSKDVFGAVLPYLQARDDPWDTLSPYHRWTPRTFTPVTLGQALRLSGPVVDVQVVPTESGRPESVTFVKKSGARVLLRAADVRARLVLRSTAFRIGVLRIARPSASVAPGTPVVISGIARDVTAPVLEKLGVNGTWLASVNLKPEPGGTFSATVTPKLTATYRLVAEGVVGPALAVTVTAKATQ